MDLLALVTKQARLRQARGVRSVVVAVRGCVGGVHVRRAARGVGRARGHLKTLERYRRDARSPASRGNGEAIRRAGAGSHRGVDRSRMARQEITWRELNWRLTNEHQDDLQHTPVVRARRIFALVVSVLRVGCIGFPADRFVCMWGNLTAFTTLAWRVKIGITAADIRPAQEG